jgi:hypothetical protein
MNRLPNLILTLEFNQVRLTDKIPMSELILPEQNFIATGILAGLLDAVLEAAGELVSPTHFVGPFNHSIYMCDVHDINAAAKTLWPVLEKHLLASGAKILRFDEKEKIWRCVLPACGDIYAWDDLIQKMRAGEDLATASMARANEVARLIANMQQPKKPDDGPKQ